jgi:hypothetical protein
LDYDAQYANTAHFDDSDLIDGAEEEEAKNVVQNKSSKKDKKGSKKHKKEK